MDTKPPRYRFLIEALLFLTYAVFGLSWIAVTPLAADLQAHFGVGAAQLALMNTLVAMGKVFTPLITGWVALRLGMARTILLGSAFISLAALVPFAPDFTSFLAGRFLFGIGGAVVVTLLGPMVMQWFPKAEMPLVNAFNNVAVNTGITVTLFATVPLAGRFGWQHTLVAYGALSVLLMFAWALVGRDRAAAAPAAGAPVAAIVRYADVWRMKETWIVALAFSGPLALYLSFNTWLPRYYVDVFGMTKAAASYYTGLFNLVGIPTAIAAGLLTQRLGLRRPFVIGAGVLMGFAAWGMILADRPAFILIAAVLLGISLFAYVAPLFTIPMELPGATPQHVSLMMATVFSCAYALSSLSPVAVGWLYDATGSYLPGLGIWATGSWSLAIGGLLLPETGTRRAPEPNHAPKGTGVLRSA